MYAISEILPLTPDCALVDFQMSVMDGMELCRELHKHTKLQKIKILMLSLRTDAHWQETANAAGADGYPIKPINADTFVTDIEQAL
jgi:CheY-like chemotaxis protein